MVYARQIRAARALLDWSQDDLAAAAGLSSTTIRNLESGEMSPRNTTTNIIRQIMETAGIEFLDGEGVRRRNNDIKVYQGPGSCDNFFEDVLQTLKDKGGEFIAVFKSQEALIESCDIKHGDLGRLELVSKHASIKCLSSKPLEPALLSPSFQFRAILRQHIGPASYFCYGDKYAIVIAEGHASFRFVVFRSLNAAEDYKNYFYTLWDLAPPLLAQLKGNSYLISA